MALFQEKDRGRKGGFFKVIKNLAIKKKFLIFPQLSIEKIIQKFPNCNVQKLKIMS
jgi:hypothetical protein